MIKEKKCSNCKYHKSIKRRNKYGKLISFSSECKLIKSCRNYDGWEETTK